MKKTFIGYLLTALMVGSSITFAADSYEIIPESKKDIATDVEYVGGKGSTSGPKTVWGRYNEKAKSYSNSNTVDVGACFASGIFSWDCINDYIVYIIRFLSQIGLVIGALMIIWSGYKYASAVFTFTGSGTPNTDNVKHAIQGVVIIIFSYAIIRILSSMFL